MKPEDVEFVKGISDYMRRGNDPIVKNNIFVASEVRRLLSLLVESEGQALYWHHTAYAHLTDNPIPQICYQDHTIKEFEAKIKKEWGI